MKTPTVNPTKPKVKIACPNCNSGQVRFTRTDGIFWCRKCGHEWKKGK
ncbi:MAG TPA: hypothetical protein VNU68_02015 [Verrucomicrobiae bacterium]|nr:hypothetical protein [Verrucomicrobiae bacterium]